MNLTHGLTAIIVGTSLAMLAACAQQQDQEAAQVTSPASEVAPPEIPPPSHDLSAYESCLANCSRQTPGQRPATTARTASAYRNPLNPGMIGNARVATQSQPLRAAQSQCLSACDALREGTN